MFSYEAPCDPGCAEKCDSCGRMRTDVSSYTEGRRRAYLCGECAPDEDTEVSVCDCCGRTGPIAHRDKVHGIGVCVACSYGADDTYGSTDRKSDLEDARRWAEVSKDRS